MKHLTYNILYINYHIHFNIIDVIANNVKTIITQNQTTQRYWHTTNHVHSDLRNQLNYMHVCFNSMAIALNRSDNYVRIYILKLELQNDTLYLNVSVKQCVRYLSNWAVSLWNKMTQIQLKLNNKQIHCIIIMYMFYLISGDTGGILS